VEKEVTNISMFHVKFACKFSMQVAVRNDLPDNNMKWSTTSAFNTLTTAYALNRKFIALIGFTGD